MSKNETFTFYATLPPIGSAIKRSGNGDGMRIQLDIPESEMNNADAINRCPQRILKVTIEVE